MRAIRVIRAIRGCLFIRNRIYEYVYFVAINSGVWQA